jgi:cobalt-zinc-cadmium efflux system outer membrane protein
MRLVVSLTFGACALLLCPAALEAQANATARAERLTESEAVARFMANNPRIRALNARIEEVSAVHAERVLWPNPAVTFSRESVFSTDDTFLLARQELPIAGRRRHLKTAGRIAVEAAQADARFRTLQGQADLRTAYTALLLAQEREAVLRNGIEALQGLVAVLRVREEGGEGSSYDRIRGARAVLDLEADLAAAAAARAQAQGQLAAYLGAQVLPETLVAADALAPSATVPLLATVLQEALSNRGDYRSTQLSIAQFDAEREAATRLRMPTPTFTGGLKRSVTGNASASGYQFSVDIATPLFSRGQAAAALASAQKARAEAEAESRRMRIEAEVRAAHTALGIHQERAARYRQSAAAIAEPLATIGRVAYEEGELGILELLDSDRQALDARLRILDFAAAARRAAIELDRAIGREFRP